jgi:Putative transmembrane protein (PGPGW)
MTVNDTHANTSRGRSRRVPTTPSESAVHRAHPTPSAVSNDGLGRPSDVPRGSWRERVRSKPGLNQAYRVGVLVTGLLFIALGFALAVLPGPLTIPPVLIGLWIWSTEFSFAQRLFASFKRKAHEAWQHAEAHPVSSTAITVGGLAAAGTAVWAISHFQLVAKGQEAIGM